MATLRTPKITPAKASAAPAPKTKPKPKATRRARAREPKPPAAKAATLRQPVLPRVAYPIYKREWVYFAGDVEIATIEEWSCRPMEAVFESAHGAGVTVTAAEAIAPYAWIEFPAGTRVLGRCEFEIPNGGDRPRRMDPRTALTSALWGSCNLRLIPPESGGGDDRR